MWIDAGSTLNMMAHSKRGESYRGDPPPEQGWIKLSSTRVLSAFGVNRSKLDPYCPGLDAGESTVMSSH